MNVSARHGRTALITLRNRLTSMSTSIFATPGRKAVGSRLEMPDDHETFPGLIVAEYMVSSFAENIRPPCWGYMTTVNRGAVGGERVAAPFLALAILYTPRSSRTARR